MIVIDDVYLDESSAAIYRTLLAERSYDVKVHVLAKNRNGEREFMGEFYRLGELHWNKNQATAAAKLFRELGRPGFDSDFDTGCCPTCGREYKDGEDWWDDDDGDDGALPISLKQIQALIAKATGARHLGRRAIVANPITQTGESNVGHSDQIQKI